MNDQSLREALERLAAEWDERDTPGLALPENQEWAKGVDSGYGVAASELRDLLTAHPVEPAPVASRERDLANEVLAVDYDDERVHQLARAVLGMVPTAVTDDMVTRALDAACTVPTYGTYQGQADSMKAALKAALRAGEPS